MSVSIYNSALNLFISPFADGPVKFVGELDDNKKIEKITRFGRDFSLVRIPYAFKLLIQELSTLNINMRIITDKNINQLSSMNATNIDNLEEFDKESIITNQPLKSETLNPEESVEALQDRQDETLEETIASNIIDLDKETQLKKQDEENEKLLVDFESQPKPSIKPDELPDIKSVPLIGIKKSEKNESDREISDKESEPITTPIDDPLTPDEFEKENLELLTDIIDEEKEEDKSNQEKTVDIK